MTELLARVEQAHVVEAMRDAYAADSAIYPVGGGTTRNFGMPAKRVGNELLLAGLDRVLDYPSRDMTITVEAGITIQKLAGILAAEGQRLPIDVAEDDRATLGGVIAANFSGPRRYGSGTIRDYVIGCSAIDGRGTPFKAGGRVVKNVAGYDFCKLLTGSLGTLAVITQATLKLKPVPEASSFVACHPASAADTEHLLAALNDSATRPSAVELLVGWSAFDENASPDSVELLVGLEGTQAEVSWSIDALSAEWDRLGV
ncbi:MAG TPA: FAD-binding protein, partial [Pirellulales bacterium]|nr:FAD-binding protein [Pirellulales bacterium]